MRRRIVPVRMTDAEHAQATACAQALGISLSRLMRSRAETLPPARTDLRTAGEVARVGSNLNQLVHQIHGGFAVQLAELEPVLRELQGQVEEIRRRLRS